MFDGLRDHWYQNQQSDVESSRHVMEVKNVMHALISASQFILLNIGQVPKFQMHLHQGFGIQLAVI